MAERDGLAAEHMDARALAWQLRRAALLAEQAAVRDLKLLSDSDFVEPPMDVVNVVLNRKIEEADQLVEERAQNKPVGGAVG